MVKNNELEELIDLIYGVISNIENEVSSGELRNDTWMLIGKLSSKTDEIYEDMKKEQIKNKHIIKNGKIIK